MNVKKTSSLIILLLFFFNSKGQSCAAPELNPEITISYITATSVEGFITAASQPADGYLVVRRTNADNDSTLWPVSGDTYIAGDLTLGGEIVNMETSITFSDFGLTDQTTYYYFIYPYNDCGDGFAYFTNVPGYPIETKAVPPCINEDFEGVQFGPDHLPSPNDECYYIAAPDDWELFGGYKATCIKEGLGYGTEDSNYASLSNSNSYLISPLVTNPTVLEFWAKSESPSQQMAFITVQYSSDGLVWKALPFYTASTGTNDDGDITTVWQRYILDFTMLNDGEGLVKGDYQIRWAFNGNPFIFAMDNIKIYCDGSQTDCPPKASWTLNDNNELGWWETDLDGNLLPGDNPIIPTTDISTTVKSDYDTATYGDFETCSLFIESGVTLNINSNSSTYHYVAVLKQLKVDGTLLIQDKNSLIMVYNDGDVINNGVINVIKKGQPTKNYDYTYWSSPVEDAPFSAFSPSDQSYIFKYVTQNFLDLYDNNTGGGTSGEPDGLDDDEPYLSDWSWNQNYDWQRPLENTMIPAEGYIVQAPTGGSSTGQEVTFNGIVNNGVVKKEVYLSSNPQSSDEAVYPFDFDDWNLIGNPYPSAIDAAAFLGNPSNIDLIGGTVYLWTHTEAISASNIGYGGYDNFAKGDYAYYNRSGEVLAFPNQGRDLLGKIASGQSFMVEVNGTGSEGTKVGEVKFINSMRFGEKESDTRTYPANDNSVFYKQRKNKKVTKTNNDDKIWLNMTENSGAFSQMLVGFFEYSQSNSEHATDGIDRAYDAFKLFSGNYIDFYSIVDDKPFAIQGREPLRNDDIIPIGFKSNIYGTLKISIDHIEGDLSGREIFLEDKLVHVDGAYHNLSKSDYEFSVIEPGVFDNRFNLRFTSVEQELESENIDNKEVLIYNSKFNEDIFIESLNGTKIKGVVVYDLLGRVIINTEFNGAGYVLRAPNFNEGTVLIFNIILDNGKMHNIKFIKL